MEQLGGRTQIQPKPKREPNEIRQVMLACHLSHDETATAWIQIASLLKQFFVAILLIQRLRW